MQTEVEGLVNNGVSKAWSITGRHFVRGQESTFTTCNVLPEYEHCNCGNIPVLRSRRIYTDEQTVYKPAAAAAAASAAPPAICQEVEEHADQPKSWAKIQ